MTWQALVMRAQRHGWRLDYLTERLVIMKKAFYRKGRQPRQLFIFFDGAVRTYDEGGR